MVRTPVPAPAGVPVIAGDLSWVHPPLAKLLIGWSERLGGYTPLSWRLPSMVFGVAGVAVVYGLAFALWRSAWWAALAGLLVAEDGLHIVQSRTAMLDVFMATFAIAGVLCLVLARRHGGLRWLLLAGALFGAAVASKWSGALVAIPAIVAWGVLARKVIPSPAAAGEGEGEGPSALWTTTLSRWRERESRLSGQTPRRWLRAVPLAAIAVYLASYTPFFIQHGPDPGGFVRLQTAMLMYHEDLQLANSMASPALSWPLMLHPNTYYYGGEGFSPTGAMLPTSREKEITTVGNPVLWWGWLGLGTAALWIAVRKRDRGAAVAVAGWACCFVPWVFIPRTAFFYYMLPAVPFMALGACAAIRALPLRLPIGIGLAIASTLAAIAFAPHWLALPVPVGYGQALRWLSGWT
ncbi:MAG: glycosyltransferase family 39 protein [Chloroflexi bacterium]|nr:glycosyltransferase family 39 protein [Chloroflexota bacterium]